MEDLRNRVDEVNNVVEKLKRQRTKGEKAIRSFVDTWFELSKEDVEACFPKKSSSPSDFYSQTFINVKLYTINKHWMRGNPLLGIFFIFITTYFGFM